MHPLKATRYVWRILKYHQLYKASKNVEGLISVNLGILLYNAVLDSSKSRSRNVLDLGCFKGLSSCFLSLGADRVGKRVKSFKLFSGLPTRDPALDPSFQVGQFSSQRNEYEDNVRVYGRPEVVDLTMGDARKTMLPVIRDEGFCVAFLDMDVYEIMREILSQLWSIARGGEVIIVHDIGSPGVRKAVDEFHSISRNIVKENEIEKGWAIKLSIPSLLTVI